MKQGAWLVAHPYLLPVAEFHSQVEKAAAALPPARAHIPNWSEYESDYLAGVPLLHSAFSPIDGETVAKLLKSLTQTLNSATLPETLGRDIRDLRTELLEGS